MLEPGVPSLGREDPLEDEMAPHSSILAWEIPRQRSLEDYSPWVHKESDMTEWLTLTFQALTGIFMQSSGFLETDYQHNMSNLYTNHD